MGTFLKNLNINKVLSLIVSILFITVLVFIIKLDILPNKYLIFLTILLGGVALLTCVANFKSKKLIWKIILAILDIILIAGSIFGIKHVNAANNFFSNIHSIKETSYYYVIVNNDSPVKKISDLENKNIGSIKSQSDDSINKLKELVNVNIKKYDDINELIKDLYDSKIDAIYMNSNIYEMLCEMVDFFQGSVRIVETVEISVTNEVKENKTDSNNDTFSILISGIDTKGPIDTVSRSDVNIVITINTKTHEVLLTAIPRDYYVQLHGVDGIKDKLTHAGIYGVDMSRRTIEDLLETNIDYYVRVNFTTLIQVVDVIGGVDVVADRTFSEFGYTFTEGVNHLNGKRALMYARIRHVLPGGDRYRGKHQQEIITAIFNKALSSEVMLKNFTEILNSVSGSFQTNIPDSMIKNLIKDQLNYMYNWNFLSINLDGYDANNYTYSMPGYWLYVMEPDVATVDNAKKYINGMKENKKFSEIAN